MTLELIDSHHHLWRQDDLAWLQGPMQPRIFGPYESIRRDYLAAEYLQEAPAEGVTGSVYVQTNWPAGRALEEVAWVQQVHDETGWPQAMVSFADLFDPDAGELITASTRTSGLVHGVRIQLHWHENPAFRFASAPDRMTDPIFQGNLDRLAGLGLSFELQVFPSQMAKAAELVARHPGTTFVLVHAGMLESTEERHLTPWLEGMTLLAEQPNVRVKLSGQGTFVHRVDQELISFVADTTIRLFGSERCMWGSNFPVEKIWTEFAPLVTAWKTALSAHSDEVQRDVFAGTARDTYQLG
jgi:predicted TIM-barrel fold metal-dependent hydrolase